MLWDEGFKSWNGFGISAQPAAWLVSRDGTRIKKWQGAMSDADLAEAARLARESS